jgi:acyl transferase domain-containing protein/acyl carrier protein
LQDVLGARRKKKLTIGSVKTNIGHLEAAAGVAGLIKACMMLKNKKIPPNINFETPNPDIPFDEMNLHVPVDVEEMRLCDGVAHIGVNSFGYGGTNAHVILSNLSEIETSNKISNSFKSENQTNEANPNRPFLLPLSARSNESLYELAKQYAEYLSSYDDDISVFIRRVSVKRNHYEYRALVQGNSKQELVDRLIIFSQGKVDENVSYLRQSSNYEGDAGVTDADSKPVFVFSGMGPQWWGMGQQLLKNEPVYKAAILECDAIFKKISGWSLLEKMISQESESEMHRTEIAQPCNFALQVGLTRLYKSWGIEPGAVVGHSVGEVTSAYVSGYLSLEDAIYVSYYRSKLQAQLAGKGGMLAIGLSLEETQNLVGPYLDSVSVAANNAPNAVTLAGDTESLNSISEQCENIGVFNRFLNVEVAYHSPIMLPIKESLIESLRHISPLKPKIPCYSTVSGSRLESKSQLVGFDSFYWWENVRNTVKFKDAVSSICDDGYKFFIEIGPHPVLTNAVKEITHNLGVKAQHHTSLNRKKDETTTLYSSLGNLYCSGLDINWKLVQKGRDVYFPLPAYPWQRSHYSNASPKIEQDKRGENGHPILYRNLQDTIPTWEVELSTSLFPYLKDHCISNNIVIPGAFYVEAALAMQEKSTGLKKGYLRNISFKRFLTIAGEDEPEEKRIRSSYNPENNEFKIHSTITARDETWTLNVTGESITSNSLKHSLSSLKCSDEYTLIDIEKYYQSIDEKGLHYGDSFRSIKTLSHNNDYVIAEVEDRKIYTCHSILPPTILDSAFQTLFVFVEGAGVPFVPVHIAGISVLKKVPEKCRVYGKLRWQAENSMQADFLITDRDNNILVEVDKVTCQALLNLKDDKATDNSSYVSEWVHVNGEQYATESIDNNESNSVVVYTFDDDSAESIEVYLNNNKVKVDHVQLRYPHAASLLRHMENNDYERVVVILNHTRCNLSDAYELSVQHVDMITNISNQLHSISPENKIDLIVCVRQSQSVINDENIKGIEFSAIWGLLRCINNELPGITASCIDYRDLESHECSQLFGIITDNNAKVRELALRDTTIFEHKLRKIQIDLTQTVNKELDSKYPIQLHSHQSDLSSEPVFRKMADQAPIKNDEVEIDIEHYILTKTDYENSRRSIFPYNPENNYFRFVTGTQCVGTIKKTGKDVSNLQINERVLTIYPVGVKTIARVESKYVLRLPEKWAWSTSTHYLPDIYQIARASYTLMILEELRNSKTLLFRGIWGHFSETLIQCALRKSVNVIFIDDVNDERTQKSLSDIPGIIYVNGQEDDEYRCDLEAIMSDIHEPIDIVVYDSNNKFDISALDNINLEVVEYVSTDLVNNIPNLTLPDTCTLRKINFEMILKNNFFRIKESVERRLHEIACGDLIVDQNPIYSLSDINTALNDIGNFKTSSAVIEVNTRDVNLLEDDNLRLPLDDDKSYLITGGTKGFGLSCAEWLATSGAKYLILWSRSGENTETRMLTKQLTKSNVTVKVMSVDVTDKNATKSAINSISKDMPPIGGVIHSAMVLDDDLISRMNYERFDYVMAPKTKGAINLYSILKDASLDFFLLFSSVSSLIGNPGQANYVAANSFLDTFSSYMRSKGIPATTINWGVLSDSGVLANDQSLSKVLAAQGIGGVNNREAMSFINSALKSNKYSQLGSFKIDWNLWSDLNRKSANSCFFSDLVNNQENNEIDSELIQILEDILELNQDQKMDYIVNKLQVKFGEIFHMTSDSVNTSASIVELGVDSLIATEIVVSLKSEFGVDISLMEMLSGPSIYQLAENILSQLHQMIESAYDSLNVDVVQGEENSLDANNVEGHGGLNNEVAENMLV